MSDQHSQILTVAQADNAIYFDFEGAKDQRPVLLGAIYAEGVKSPNQDRLVMRHDFVDRFFAPLLDAVRLEAPSIYRYDTSCRSLTQAYADLVGRARAQDRLMVSWSRHELTMSLEAGLPRNLLNSFVERFRDGKATAKRWRTLTQPDVSFERDHRGRIHTLTRYAELTGFPVPVKYLGGTVGRTIKRVRSGLERVGEWNGLTSSQQDAWCDVVGHNFYDCAGLRHVVRTAAEDLEQIS